MEFAISTFSGLRSYFSLILAVAGVLTGSGCAPVDDSGSGSSDQTKVFRIPWPSGNGEYTLQDISLSTFRDHEKFRGDVALILVDPRIESGVVISDEPIGRFNRAGRRFTPADFISLQATTIYAHLERLHQLDQTYGLDSYFKGPARIGLSARISAGPSSPLIFNNAIYDGRLDSLFFVPFTGERLPIALNGGIVAHEHFHRTFQSVILNSIREAARTGSIPYGWDDSIACTSHDRGIQLPPIVSEQILPGDPNELVPLKIYNQVLLRALNEGLADFWGWAYTRDDEFVGRSLGESESKARRLDKPSSLIPQRLLLRNNLVTISSSGRPVLKSEEGRVAAAYRFGTEYARTVRGFSDRLNREAGLSPEDAIEKVRSAVALSMPELSREILKNWGRKEIEPDSLLKPMLKALLRGTSPSLSALDASVSKSVCAELLRLSASSELMSELCVSSAPLPVGDGAAPVVPTPERQ